MSLLRRDPADVCATPGCGHLRGDHIRGMRACRILGCRCAQFKKEKAKEEEPGGE